jgi:hypothetical protein
MSSFLPLASSLRVRDSDLSDYSPPTKRNVNHEEDGWCHGNCLYICSILTLCILAVVSIALFAVGGSLAFCDPEDGVSYAWVTNTLGTGKWDDPREKKVRDAFYTCLENRS